MAYQRLIRESGTAHVGQPALDLAARKAVTKYVGDVQQWDRRDRKVDISPLVSVSTAVHLWSLAVAKPPEKFGSPRRHTGTERTTPQRRKPASPARRTRRPTSGGFDPRSSGF